MQIISNRLKILYALVATYPDTTSKRTLSERPSSDQGLALANQDCDSIGVCIAGALDDLELSVDV